MPDPVVPQPEVEVLNTAPVAEAAPAVVAEPVVEAAPAAEAPVVEAPVVEAPKTVADTPSLMEEVGETKPAVDGEKPAVEGEEAKPAVEAEKPAVEGEPKPEAKADEKPVTEEPAAEKPVALEPIEWTKTYELPEAIVMDDTQRGRFHETLDAMRADPSKGVQPLIDLHYEAMQNFSQKVFQEQQDTFLKTREGWRGDIKTEFGGEGWDQTRVAVATTRNEVVSAAEPGSDQYVREWKEFQEFCRVTGAGDHPVMFRLMHNVAQRIGEPKVPGDVGDMKPAPNGKAPGRKRDLMYNHPTSPNNRS